MLNWIHVCTPSWPVHDLNILLVQKGCRVTCCMVQGICLGRTQSSVQTPPSPMATFDSSGSWCTDAGSWLHSPRPAHSSPMVDCTPYHDWRATISLRWTQASISLSPCIRRTRTRPSLWCRENRDSSLKIQCLHCLRSHTLCLLPHSQWRRLCSKVSLGHVARRRDQYPMARRRLRMVLTDIHLPNRRIICIRRRGAEMKWFVLTIQSSWRSSRGVEIFIEPPHILWCGRPVSRLRHKTLLMHPWDTPSILATSCWELPSAYNLKIRCSICSGKFCGMIPFKSSKKYQ